MNKKIDLRIQRTYKSLTDALLSTLKEKSFDDITVGELCKRAMIRRATFYKHFGDKYELYTFVIRSLQEQFEEDNVLEFDSTNPQSFYVEMIDRSFQLVEQNSDVFTSVIMAGNSSKVLLDILSQEIEKDLLQHLISDKKSGVILPTAPELLASMITGALVNTMKWWVLNGKKMPREEIISVFTSLIKII